MFAAIAAFEFRYQIKNPVFWVSGLLFFLLTFASVTVDTVQIGATGAGHVNGSYAVIVVQLTLSVFFMFVTTAFVADVVVRDDATAFGPILRSTRIRKFDYLYGRFIGAFAAAALVFLAVPLAILIGSAMPWLDSEKVGPFRPLDYVDAYVVWVLPSLFFTAAAFFALASVTRSMMATYVGVVGFLMLFFISAAIRIKLETQGAAPYLDPFGLGAFGQATRYFSAAERNTVQPAIAGAVLWSRLEWLALGAILLACAYPLYRFETRAPRVSKRSRAVEAARARAPVASELVARRSFGATAQARQLWARTRFDMAQVFRSPAFFVLLALGLFNSVAGLWFGLDGAYGSAIHPMTRLVITTLRGSFLIIPMIIAVYYAGELVWRERERKTAEIVDSTPAPDWTFAVPKMLAISLVLFATIVVSVVAGVAVQVLKGGAPDFGEYLAWYVWPETISTMQLAVLAVLLQTLAPHKFVGWLLMIGFVVAQTTLGAIGFEHNLYQFGSGPEVALSDMNGARVSGAAAGWFRGYWSCITVALAVLAYALWRRGGATSLVERVRRLPRRLAGPHGLSVGGAILGVSLLLAVGLGGFIFANTNVWNVYRTARGDEDWLADYEKTLLPYEKIAQPKITDVSLDVQVHPHAPAVVTRGVYAFENRTDQPIRELHVRFDREAVVRSLSVEGAHPTKSFERFNYRIFTFDTPMLPHARRRLSFTTWRGRRGFKNSGNGSSRVYDNGTFLDNTDISPQLGMDRDGLMRDRAQRRKHHLPSELRPPKLEDVSAERFNQLRHDSDWVNADIRVTTDADQTPIAPGYKVSDVTQGGRRTARFRTEAPINHFFSVQSAHYLEKHVNYKGVDLGVYYDRHHPWNVDRMIAALKVGLDYDQANFSPYQFRQVRILEFPDYARFAQSFANTIPYSEGIGFLFKPPKDPVAEQKIDMVTYITAHELGHQWWAHQVLGSDQQGSTVLVETLAQYSALMAMEKIYGRAAMGEFLKHERDAYLRARGSEAVEELPLERVEDQGYIHYNKGSLVMYRLRDVIGEAAVNRALRRLIHDHAFKGAPYPRSLDLVAALRAEAGPDPARQALIDDLFARITLYDLKVVRARTEPGPQGGVRVSFTVAAKKLYADGHGVERAAPFAETLPFAVVRAGKGPPSARWTQFVRPVHSGVNAFSVDLPRGASVALVEVDPENELLLKAPADASRKPG